MMDLGNEKERVRESSVEEMVEEEEEKIDDLEHELEEVEHELEEVEEQFEKKTRMNRFLLGYCAFAAFGGFMFGYDIG